MKIVSCTDIGKVRGNNEDYLSFDMHAGIAILADGMGGLNAGEVASETCVLKILAELRAKLPPERCKRRIEDCGELLQLAVKHANNTIFQMSRQNIEFNGMGTTIVATVQTADAWVVAHVGDSRMYHYGLSGDSEGRKPDLVRVTRDHSQVQQLLDEGVLTPEEARVAPNRNIITRAVGIAAQVKCELSRVELGEGEILILCSDGLSDMVDDDEIAQLCMMHYLEPDLLCQKLKDRANAEGGQDNISIILICT